MRFLFVDLITEIDERSIKGRKRFAVDAPMQYAGVATTPEISPAAISEAIGQLVSWLAIKNNDFTGRPVFLFADAISVHAAVKPGTTVLLSARITSEDKESGTFAFSGEAFVGDTLVHTVENCSGYYMPLADLEDPEVTRQRFNSLVDGGLILTGDDGLPPFPFATLAGETVTVSQSEILTRKTYDAGEAYYKDHFPRFPVTPIVMINEMIGQTTMRLLGAKNGLRVKRVEGVKIRNFVKPGETVETIVKLLKRERDENGIDIAVTTAEVKKDGKPILRGRYTYECGAEQ